MPFSHCTAANAGLAGIPAVAPNTLGLLSATALIPWVVQASLAMCEARHDCDVLPSGGSITAAWDELEKQRGRMLQSAEAVACLPCTPDLCTQETATLPSCSKCPCLLQLTHAHLPGVLQLPGSILVTPTSLEFVDLRAKVLPTEFLGIRTVKRDQLEQQQQVSCPSSRWGPCRGGLGSGVCTAVADAMTACTESQAQQQAHLCPQLMAGSSGQCGCQGCRWGPLDSAAVHHSA